MTSNLTLRVLSALFLAPLVFVRFGLMGKQMNCTLFRCTQFYWPYLVPVWLGNGIKCLTGK